MPPPNYRRNIGSDPSRIYHPKKKRVGCHGAGAFEYSMVFLRHCYTIMLKNTKTRIHLVSVDAEVFLHPQHDQTTTESKHLEDLLESRTQNAACKY